MFQHPKHGKTPQQRLGNPQLSHQFRQCIVVRENYPDGQTAHRTDLEEIHEETMMFINGGLNA